MTDKACVPAIPPSAGESPDLVVNGGQGVALTTDLDNMPPPPQQPPAAPLDYEAVPAAGGAAADTLGQKTIWNMLAMVTNIGSSTVAGIVVARVLGPKGVGEVGY